MIEKNFTQGFYDRKVQKGHKPFCKTQERLKVTSLSAKTRKTEGHKPISKNRERLKVTSLSAKNEKRYRSEIAKNQTTKKEKQTLAKDTHEIERSQGI